MRISRISPFLQNWVVDCLAVDSNQDCFVLGHVVVVQPHLIFNHLQNNVLQWCRSVRLGYFVHMHFRGFYFEHIVRLLEHVLRELLLSEAGYVKDLLLGNRDCILGFQTREVDLLVQVVLLVYFVKNLPSYIPVYLLESFLVLISRHALASGIAVALSCVVLQLHLVILLLKDTLVFLNDFVIALLSFFLDYALAHFALAKRALSSIGVHVLANDFLCPEILLWLIRIIVLAPYHGLREFHLVFHLGSRLGS